MVWSPRKPEKGVRTTNTTFKSPGLRIADYLATQLPGKAKTTARRLLATRRPAEFAWPAQTVLDEINRSVCRVKQQ